jgi:hypothetical protein
MSLVLPVSSRLKSMVSEPFHVYMMKWGSFGVWGLGMIAYVTNLSNRDILTVLGVTKQAYPNP